VASVLFATVGSWGDLFPFVGVARELQQRGHRVRLGASPAWEREVTEAGVEFVPLGRWIGVEEFEQHPEILRPVPFGLRAALGRFLFDQADTLSEDLGRAMADVDLLVAHPAHLIAQSVAEARGTPYVVATVFAGMIPSQHTVPGATPVGPWRGPVGRAMNRMAWRSAAAITAVLFDRPINRHRQSLGLGPVRAGPLQLPLRGRGIVVMSSPVVIPPPPDWPSTVRTTSFVRWDRAEARPLTPQVSDFVGASTPPVLITLGGSGGIGASGFLEFATDVVVAAGARALVVSGVGPPPQSQYGPAIVHVTDYVPFGAVAASCRLGIHHAGIGTSVALMRAGVPHVAVPRAFDQPVTASVIEDLGVGIALPWRQRRRLANAVKTALNTDHYAAAASRLAKKLSPEPDGAGGTADVIEEVLMPGQQTR
jgi:rhamnosyltransferase subunit B